MVDLKKNCLENLGFYNEKKIHRNFGFYKEVKLVESGLCPFCHAKIDIKDFRDSLSLKEYKISGLCQICQDSVFGE